MLRILVVLLFVLPAVAQPARTHNITLDDYATLATIRELAVSPDGKFVAYTEARWDKADDSQKTDLWVVATDGKSKPTRLTGDRANDRHPKWHGDGKSIFVLGNRKSVTEGKTQIYRIDAASGFAQAITKVESGITNFDYAPRDGSIHYTVDTDATDNDEFSKLRSKHKAEYGHGTRKVSEVHRLDLQSWRTEKLIAEGRYVREFAVTQDGKRIAMVSCIDDTVIKSEGESRVDIWEDGKVVTPPTDVYRAKAASPHAWLEGLAWNPEGSKVAFCAIFDAHPAEVIIQTHSDDHWMSEKMDRDGVQIIGYGSPLKWSNESKLHMIVYNSGNSVMARYDGKRIIGVESGFGAINFDLHLNSAITATVYSRNDYFPALLLGEYDIPGGRIIQPNLHLRNKLRPKVNHVNWKAADGTHVGGILELPPDYKKGDKLPLVVGLHGGPTTSTKAELSYDPHNGRLYFAAHGYAAFFPNYRGSTGYGDKFVTDLIGRENDIEVKDILAGIQHLIKEGIADPDRIGVMGWSNGGYLTNCLIALKDSPVKFKAASSGAGILDTEAQWGFNDEPAYMAVFKKGLPWEVPDAYRKASPLYGLGNVTTPTLIHVGGNDERCPPGHSKMLYRALKEYRKVPTELVVYPNQPHGLTKLSNRLAKMEWDLAWFDKYVKGVK